MTEAQPNEAHPQTSDTPATAPAPAGRLLTWPNWLFLGVFIFTCYQRIRNNVSPLPDYILVIETIGICVWLLPFALFYNIDGRPITKNLYIAANIGFLLIFLAWGTLK